MASITRSVQIVKIDDKNPTEQQLLAALERGFEVEFAYKTLPAYASSLGVKDKGLMKVKIDLLNPKEQSHTGGYLITGRYYPVPGEKPIIVRGFFDCRNVSGTLDLTRND